MNKIFNYIMTLSLKEKLFLIFFSMEWDMQ